MPVGDVCAWPIGGGRVCGRKADSNLKVSRVVVDGVAFCLCKTWHYEQARKGEEVFKRCWKAAGGAEMWETESCQFTTVRQLSAGQLTILSAMFTRRQFHLPFSRLPPRRGCGCCRRLRVCTTNVVPLHVLLLRL